MKKLLLCLAFGVCAISYSQLALPIRLDDNNPKKIKENDPTYFAKGGTLEVYWSEDFSNGFEGQGENGLWTTDGQQGDLWFHTFPVGAENGYDPEGTIEAYGESIPNYFGSRDVVSSPSRDNGVIMFDGDRYNSTRTDPTDDPGSNTTAFPISASLISPVIDLSGIEYADVCLYVGSRYCCGTERSANLDLSFDGGDSWQLVDTIGFMKDNYDSLVCKNISLILLAEEDQSNTRLRFRWNEELTHYFLTIDDIKIQARPSNNLLGGQTWYNNYYELSESFENGTLTAEEYYNSFEYFNTPSYFTRPLNFAMVATNDGAEVQTGVQLLVTVTTPSGQVLNDFESEPISLAQFEKDTIQIPGIEFGSAPGQIPIENGIYSCEYLLVQNEEEFSPENNVGTTRFFMISTEAQNDGYTLFRNDGNTYNGAYTTLGEDVIWSVPYVFSEPQVENAVITHLEAVFSFNEFLAETVPGSIVYFNLRSGSVLEENPDDPESMTTVFFDSDNPLEYDDVSLEYEIQEDDIWDVDNDETPSMIWTTFELPNPIMINSGEIYQAEYRVPNSFIYEVYPPVTGNQEPFAATIYDFDDEEWFYLNTNSIPLRMRITNVSDVKEVSYEAGIQLLQNYPNPADDFTRIQYRLEEASDVIFEVFDITGKLVHAEDHGRIPAGIAQTFNLDVNRLNAGVYTYSIVANGERVTRKLTIR